MEVITIANRKGGVGKTATTHALGNGLRLKGYSVLFIDLDSQCNLTTTLQAVNNGVTSLEVLTGTNTITDAIQHTPGGDVIPASPNLVCADGVLTETGKEYRLKEALEDLKGCYDYVIIDTPPSLNIATTNALTCSSRVIIPSEPDTDSLQGIALLWSSIQPIKKYCNSSLELSGILITRYTDRATINKDMRSNLEAIAQQLNTKVYATPIRECVAIKEAKAMHDNIFNYAPKSNACRDYSDFLEEFIHDIKEASNGK